MSARRAMALAAAAALFVGACAGDDDNDTEPAADATTPVTDAPDDAADDDGADDSTDNDAEPFKLGAVIPLSGAFEVFGNVALSGIEYTVAELNEAGGILGRQIEIEVYDNRSTPEGAVEGAREVILNGGVEAIVGPQSSAEREAMIPIITELETPLLYYSVYEGGNCDEFMWVFGGDIDVWLKGYVEWLVEEYGPRFYVVGWDYVVNTEIASVFEEWLPELGGELVGADFIPFTATDYSATIRGVIDADVDVLYNGMYGNVQFFETATDFGLKDRTHMASPTVDRAFLEALSEEAGADLSWSMNWELADDPIDTAENEAFLRGWNEMFGPDRQIGAWAVTVYNSIMMYAEAAERAGTTEPRAVRAELAGATFVGPDGMNVFQGESNHLDVPMRIFRSGGPGDDFVIETVEDLGTQESRRDYCNEEWLLG